MAFERCPVSLKRDASRREPIGVRARRVLLISAGALFVGLGVVGVVLPLLPTTPFLLLAAACFVRSSARLHRWLLGNRVFGDYLRRYRDGEGLPLASKLTTLVLLWGTLAVSALAAAPPRLWWVRLLLLAVGGGVTVHILRIKTQKVKGAKRLEPGSGAGDAD